MGYQHGKQAAPLIRRYLEWISKLTGSPLRQLASHAFRFMPLVQHLSRKYIDEVLGLAEGAGISIGEAMLCQVRGEAVGLSERACTTFALTRSATNGRVPLAGQNQDLEPGFADVAIVLKIKPSDGRPKAVMLTFAGQLGYAGMNDRGVANFANSLYNFQWRFAVSHYPLKRCFVEQSRVQACIELLRRYRTCSAANVMLCDGKGAIRDVEIRPEGIRIFNGSNSDALVHTNHYLTSDFQRFERGTLPDSPARLQRFQTMVNLRLGKITVDTLKAMLADHAGYPASICRHGADGLHSICGYIAEPAKSTFHVRRGYGCSGTWDAHRIA